MRKITILVSSILLALQLAAQTAPSLLINSEPASLSKALCEQSAASITLGAESHIAAQYATWAPSSANNTLAGLRADFRLSDKLHAGLRGKYLLDNIPVHSSTTTGAPAGEYKPSELALELLFGYQISESFAAGLSAKYVSSKFAKELGGGGIALDLSAAYSFGALTADLAVCNLGPALKYDLSSYALPSYAKAGLKYDFTTSFNACAEASYLFSGAFNASIGAEYGIADIAFLRAGYHLGSKSKGLPSFASMGLGVKLAGIHLDAAYLLASDALSNTLLLSLSYSF